MSKIALSGNASGTGTFTIASPNSNSDRTLNLPDAAGTIQVSGNPISGTTGTFTGLVDISAAGAGQIQFPATQNASSNANTLDDYEEGTFTPTIAFGGGSSGLTYTSRNGAYTKIGNVVFFRIGIDINSKGASTGNMTVGGLPFTSASGSYVGWPVAANLQSFTGLTGAVGGIVDAGATTLVLEQSTASGSAAITDANAASGFFFIAGFYTV